MITLFILRILVICVNTSKLFDEAVTDYVEEQPKAANAWLLYNQLTHYISHHVQQRMRASIPDEG